MLFEQIRADLTAATKAQDKLRQRTLRSVIAAVQEASVSGEEARELTDDEVRAVVKAQVKRRHDAADAFDSGGRSDRADDERAEIAVLETYLPAALTDDDVEAIVTDVLAANEFTTRADMGRAMKAVNEVIAGRADGRRVAELVKSQLT